FGVGLALIFVDTWLVASFAGDRHKRRLDKITELER
ncbi:ribose-5-phosphate isomerase, partial [Listeria monocytogenes]